MMWNWQASVLLTGATIVAIDGAPGHPRLDMLWQLSAQERITHFGTSARFLAACRKAELSPGLAAGLKQRIRQGASPGTSSL